MTLTISLPSDAEAKLEQRARAAGQDVTHYLESLIAKKLAAPISIVEAAEPFTQAVDASGVTDDEFQTLLIESRDAARRSRKRA